MNLNTTDGEAFRALVRLAERCGRIAIDYAPEWEEGPYRLLGGGDDGCESDLLISGDATEIRRLLPELAPKPDQAIFQCAAGHEYEDEKRAALPSREASIKCPVKGCEEVAYLKPLEVAMTGALAEWATEAYLKEWRDPKTGRRWPDNCSLSTEPLTSEELEVIRDMAMTYNGFDAVPRWLKDEIISRLLATIEEGLSR